MWLVFKSKGSTLEEMKIREWLCHFRKRVLSIQVVMLDYN
jgi:hypothetical protein